VKRKDETITCGDHVMPRFRSGTPDTAEPLHRIKKTKFEARSKRYNSAIKIN